LKFALKNETLKILIIQTAFIGDVVLATPLVEKLRRFYRHATLDFLLRQGNEKLLAKHPHLRKIWVWNKKQSKYREMWRILRQIRAERYDVVVNCQRFAASGLLTALSGARQTIGFDKNPFSIFFERRLPHRFGTAEQPLHEVSRNLSLIEHLSDTSFERPRLYPSPADCARAAEICGSAQYVCIAPTSVWFTKQYLAHKWVELIRALPDALHVALLGGPDDASACAAIAAIAARPYIHNLAGRLTFLESAALMQGAVMNYVNDSAPMHIASAVNAPVTAVFCSTLPAFGFTPLSDQSRIVQTRENLACRPCGLHGRPACPLGHFRCAEGIETRDLFVGKVL
jgi:ADP-heptose:LPS heptosyltransferase